MNGTPVTAEIRVLDLRMNPAPASHRERWIVRCQVVHVLSGSMPEPRSTVTLFVHSPTKTLGASDRDLHDYAFTLRFEDPVTEPYTGRFSVIDRRRVGVGQ